MHVTYSFTVLKGNPTAEELAALQVALDRLVREGEAAGQGDDAERNLWGRRFDTVFNPRAFRTVSYY